MIRWLTIYKKKMLDDVKYRLHFLYYPKRESKLMSKPQERGVKLDARKIISLIANLYKNLCGRDGRTICGPQRVLKSTCVSLQFARWRNVTLGNHNGTDGQTDGQTECDA